ncbi:hypothetical protein HH310_12590 [Actinoplanes sp. TBRC 11911]|uniref:hypothetical protein n=1 Tax=Actinoplanes sp. TBRC 11911 TaxID=2729386 RepID=UPI00145E45D4|nr:hypothetical protein [Actinoplanes sp. TBRC 11911]NMO52031.1 hypothetical protein [Actinoplanes sp. TBRC 11911]
MDAVAIEPDHDSFTRVARALRDEAPGREWRQDLSKGMGAALAPGVAAVRSAVLSRGGGAGHEGQPLRQAVAAAVHVVPLDSGATIVADHTPQVRQFAHAPKRLNERGGWRRRVFGSNVTVIQIGAPGWFDDTLQDNSRLHAAAYAALDGRAGRIARKV